MQSAEATERSQGESTQSAESGEGSRPPRISRRDVLKAGGVAALTAATFGIAGYKAAGESRPVRPQAVHPATAAGRHAYRSRPDLTPPIIAVNGSSPSVAPGYVFFTPANGAGHDGPMIADNAGEPVWVLPGTGKQTANFRVSMYQGQPVLTWWEGDVNGGNGLGETIIADSSYKELRRVKAGHGYRMDLHEFLITPKDTAIFTVSNYVSGNLPTTRTPAPWPVWDNVIQEVDIASGDVLFEWHAYDHIAIDETYEQAPTSGTGKIFDYVHANAIEVDTDNNLILCARHTFAVYKIDRSTGKILWRLGGKKSDFLIGQGANFSWQHDARRQSDGTLTLFDDRSAPGHSRGITLRLDEGAMLASLVRAYPHPKGLLATSQGNMQVLQNGNVFVGWGASPYFSEFASEGGLLFDATFPSAIQSYRSFRFPWVGRPTEAPAAYAETTDGGAIAVYASWNGATDVATWDVAAGSDAGSMAVVGRAPKSGFETRMRVYTREPLVTVTARNADGKPLGTSRPVPTRI